MKSKSAVPTVAVPFKVWETWYKRNRAYADAEILRLTGRPGQRATRKAMDVLITGQRSPQPG